MLLLFTLTQLIFGGIFFFFGLTWWALFFAAVFGIYIITFYTLSFFSAPILTGRSHLKTRVSQMQFRISAEKFRMHSSFYAAICFFYLGVIGICYGLSLLLPLSLLDFLNGGIFIITLTVYLLFFLSFDKPQGHIYFLFRAHMVFALTLYCLLAGILYPFGMLALSPLLVTNGALLCCGVLIDYLFDTFSSKMYKKYSFFIFLAAALGGSVLVSLRLFPEPWLAYQLFLICIAFFYSFVFPTILSYSKDTTHKNLLKKPGKIVSWVLITTGYVSLIVGILFGVTASVPIAILGVLASMTYFSYLHLLQKQLPSLVYLLSGTVAMYTYIIHQLGPIGFSSFIFLTLFLPLALIFSSFYTSKQPVTTTYTIHYFGLGFMIYMTLRAIFGLQEFSGGTSLGILSISTLLLLESFVWYASWVRITTGGRDKK